MNIDHFNYLKQFMVKLFRNNLYFKNVTSIFSDSGTICNSCKSEAEDRIHFFKCKIHHEIIENLFFGFTQLKQKTKTQYWIFFFFNFGLPLNHPTNLIYISTLKCIYNLLYHEIVPTWKIIRNHLSKFINAAILMYPGDQTWNKCSAIPIYFYD